MAWLCTLCSNGMALEHGMALMPCHSLMAFLYPVTIESTFENFYPECSGLLLPRSCECAHTHRHVTERVNAFMHVCVCARDRPGHTDSYMYAVLRCSVRARARARHTCGAGQSCAAWHGIHTFMCGVCVCVCVCVCVFVCAKRAHGRSRNLWDRA